MTFKLRVNGEDVWSTDQQVNNVSLMSARGEAGRIGISTEGVVDVVVSEIPSGGPMRLDHYEAMKRQEQRDFQEGGSLGIREASTFDVGRGAKATQGEHDYTARTGDAVSQEGGVGPDVDLAKDINRQDYDSEEEFVAARTKAVEEFSKSQSKDDKKPVVDLGKDKETAKAK